jgi:hypothetical protein
MLMECVVERTREGGHPLLLVHWLTLQNPRLRFDTRHEPLPGQQHPGLGLGPEVNELLSQVARRLGLEGIAFQPAWYHMALLLHERCQFLDPEREGRFRALRAALAHLPMLAASQAVSEGRVTLDGSRYDWETGTMVGWAEPHQANDDAIAAAQANAHFELTPRSAPAHAGAKPPP